MTYRGWIYFLLDPETNEIRYIGKTADKAGPAQRLRVQRYAATRYPKKTYFHRWMNTVDCRPVQQLVAEFYSPEELDAAEVSWIAYGREQGWRLTNTHDGGTGGDTNSGRRYEMSASGRAAIKAAAQARDNTRLASIARTGGEAAAKKQSIPRSCVPCRLALPSQKAWRAHWAEEHGDIIAEQRAAAAKKARDARWRSGSTRPVTPS